MPRLTKPAFEKFGFPAAVIVTDWTAIAGRDLASFTLPERLRWPREREQAAGDTYDAEADSGQKRGATLVLRVDGPRAIEVQFMAGQIIERINVYFGYRAISELRILQAPLPRQNVTSQMQHRSKQQQTPVALPGIENLELRQALERLSANIGTAKRPSS